MCTITSERGNKCWISVSALVATPCASSKLVVRGTANVTSTKVAGPLCLKRRRFTAATPGIRLTSRSMSDPNPFGALSSRPLIVRLPNWMLTYTTITDTPRAAMASAWDNQCANVGELVTNFCPINTANNPKMTTVDDQTSVEKCKASASRAWLACFLAIFISALDLVKSITIETAITMKLQ